MKSLFLCALLLAGCVEVDMLGDRRLLDRRTTPQLLGKSADIVPGVTAAATSRFVQNFPFIEVTAEELRDAELVTIAVDAFQSGAIPAVTPPTQVYLQGVLRFGTGNAVLGGAQDAPPPAFGGATTRLNGEIIFDLQSGTQLTIPASSFTLSVRYIALKAGAAWGPGVQIGPNFRVDVAYGYGSNSNPQDVTETEVIIALAPAGNGVVNKAPFARSLRINWAEWVGSPGPATPATIDFISASGVAIWTFSLTNANPIPEFPWPPGAVAVSITNASAVAMSAIEVIQTLSL
jgi:hypothetical protein